MHIPFHKMDQEGIILARDLKIVPDTSVDEDTVVLEYDTSKHADNPGLGYRVGEKVLLINDTAALALAPDFLNHWLRYTIAGVKRLEQPIEDYDGYVHMYPGDATGLTKNGIDAVRAVRDLDARVISYVAKLPQD